MDAAAGSLKAFVRTAMCPEHPGTTVIDGRYCVPRARAGSGSARPLTYVDEPDTPFSKDVVIGIKMALFGWPGRPHF